MIASSNMNNHTRYIKNKFEKGSRDHNKTSSYLKPVRNSYVTIMHQPVIVNSNTCSKMYVK